MNFTQERAEEGGVTRRLFELKVGDQTVPGAIWAPEGAKGPAFAVAAGLLVYPQFAYLEHCEPRKTRQLMTGTDSYFSRVGRWLRESF